MTILVIDGQGGKLGKTLVENIKKSFPHLEIMAYGQLSLIQQSKQLVASPMIARNRLLHRSHDQAT